MKLEKHIYEWDRIVIGGDLRSLLYAVLNNLPVMFSKPSPPFRFETFAENFDFTRLGFSKEDEPSQEELWERLIFLAGISGLLPLSFNANSIRVKEDLLVATTKNLRVIKGNFKKLLVFEPDQIKDLPETLETLKGPSKVVDWFNVRYGCRHDIEHILFEDEFIKELYFYPTDRSDNNTLKDAVAVSYLNEEQIGQLDFTEVMARHKVEYLMKEAGIKGPINGYRHGKPVHLSIKIEHADREVVSNTKRTFKKDDRFEFLDLKLSEILEQPACPSYAQKLVGAP